MVVVGALVMWQHWTKDLLHTSDLFYHWAKTLLQDFVMKLNTIIYNVILWQLHTHLVMSGEKVEPHRGFYLNKWSQPPISLNFWSPDTFKIEANFPAAFSYLSITAVSFHLSRSYFLVVFFQFPWSYCPVLHLYPSSLHTQIPSFPSVVLIRALQMFLTVFRWHLICHSFVI